MISTTGTGFFIAKTINMVLKNSSHKQYLFCLNFRANLHHEDSRKRLHSVHIPAPDFHILIDGHSNYVGVWCCEIYPNVPAGTGIRHWWELKDEDWKFVTNHDTWMTSAFGSNLFNIWCKLRDDMEKECKRRKLKVSLHELNDSISLSWGLTDCKKVSFDIENDQSQFCKYDVKNLKVLEDNA